MINSYLTDKGVYNFISSAEVSSSPQFSQFVSQLRARSLVFTKTFRFVCFMYVFANVRGCRRTNTSAHTRIHTDLVLSHRLQQLMTLFISMHTHTHAGSSRLASHKIDVICWLTRWRCYCNLCRLSLRSFVCIFQHIFGWMNATFLLTANLDAACVCSGTHFNLCTLLNGDKLCGAVATLSMARTAACRAVDASGIIPILHTRSRALPILFDREITNHKNGQFFFLLPNFRHTVSFFC